MQTDLKINLQGVIPAESAAQRLDQAVAQLFPKYSRSVIKQWIDAGFVVINGELKKPREKVVGGEEIIIRALLVPEPSWEPENSPLDIIYQDEALLVINKPANLVVHPAAGHASGTLINALLHFDPSLATLPRAGIVHRLDKDTTGLMVVARTLAAHHHLVAQLQARTVKRIYHTVVAGIVRSNGKVEAAIGRHPYERKKMAVNTNGKIAISHYKVITRFSNHTYLEVQLETGRTHQIRVHMAHIRHPVIGDKTYGGRQVPNSKIAKVLQETLKNFPRQALQAKELCLIHPITHEYCQFEVPLTKDMQILLGLLKEDAKIEF